ncbi:MAG: hypothetical protein V3V35_10370 [Dehalococcoidia bacterium]
MVGRLLGAFIKEGEFKPARAVNRMAHLVRVHAQWEHRMRRPARLAA